MGEPKFSRRKYDKPSHPWDAERIKAENEILKKYCLKNKKELWRAEYMLRNFREQARNLQARLRYKDPQALRETKQLLDRLKNLGLIATEAATIDDVLALNVESILSRRLQNLCYMKRLAYSQAQARQFIVHGHIYLGGRKVTIPGYLVKKAEEDTLSFNPYSKLADELHPARPKKEPYLEFEKRQKLIETAGSEGSADKK